MLPKAFYTAIVTTLVYWQGVSGLVPNLILPQQVLGTPSFDWKSIKPANDLDFHEFYEDFQRSLLRLPLDWHNYTNDNQVDLAVIRLRASVPEDHPSHGGSIIVNPGGPGGPGVLYAFSIARRMQHLLDEPKHYDTVGFDPRGVFYSSPNAFCFPTAMETEIWLRAKRAVGNLDSGEAVRKLRVRCV